MTNIPYHNFLEYVKEHFSFLEHKRLLLGVSGGVDSMVMLDLLHQLDCDLIVCHINYHLRSEASDADAQLVKQVCDHNGILCYIEDAPELANSGNFQNKAREVRYQFFNHVVKTHQADYICLAHHLNDSIETMLHNLFRGTDIGGLVGINSVRNNVVRPLSAFTKDQIYRYAGANAVTYREDASNAETKYTRNAIRNVVLPEMESHLPNINKRLHQTLQHLDRANAYIENITSHLIKPYLKDEIGAILIDQKLFKDIDDYQNVLYYYLKAYGFNQTQIANIVAVKNTVGKTFDTEQYKLYVDRDVLVLKQCQSYHCENVTIATSNWNVELLNYQMSDRSLTDYDNCMNVQSDKLVYPLTLRHWQAGDKIAFTSNPIRHKKLKKLFNDKRVRIDLKSEIPVLVNGDNQIIWVVGVQKSQMFEQKRRGVGVMIYYKQKR